MSINLEGQLDYISFVCGICFMLIGLCCLVVKRDARQRLPWGWLAGFCAFGAGFGFSETLRACYGTRPAFDAANVILGALSYLCLIEFGRVGMGRLTGKSSGRWIYAPLLIVALSGIANGWQGLAATTRYGLGFPGGLWAAIAFGTATKGSEGGIRSSLMITTAVVFVYSLFDGLIPPYAPFFPASVINQQAFLRVLGFPYEAIFIPLGFAGITAFWIYFRALSLSNFDLHERRMRARLVIGALAAIICVLSLGGALIQYAGHTARREARQNMMLRAMTISTAINSTRVKKLVSTPNDATSRQRLTARLLTIQRANPDCRSIQVYALVKGVITPLVSTKGGKVVADSVDKLSAAEESWVLRNARGLEYGPTKDSSGRWMAVSAPVRDIDTGRTVGTVKMELSYDPWQHDINTRRLTVLVVILLVCIALVSSFWILMSTRESSARISASERRYRSLVEGSPNCIELFDRDACYMTINETGLRARGWQEKDVAGRSYFSIWPGDTFPMVRSAVDQVLSGSSSSFEAECERSDGSMATWHVVLNPILDNHGKVSCFVGISNDITERKLAEEALRQSEEQYRLITDSMSDGIFTVDFGGRFTYISPRWLSMTGYSPDDLFGHCFLELLAEDGRPKANDYFKRGLSGENVPLCEVTIITKEGRRIPIELNMNNLVDKDGSIVGRIGVFRDVTERKLAESSLRMHESAMNAASDLVIITDTRGKIEFVNRAFERVTGYSAEEVLGKNPHILSSGNHDRSFYSKMWNTILSGETWHEEITNRGKDGRLYTEDSTITPVKNDMGVIERFIAIQRDVTERMVYEEKLDHLAHHDTLTNLPNRRLFIDRLTQRVLQAHRLQESIAVMFVDLDRFKLINDTLGHNVGDVVLKAVSLRLQSCVREEDTIAHMSGDEFTVILGEITTTQDAAMVARRVLRAFSKPFIAPDGRELFVTASVGISVYPSDGADVETLVKNADAAMYRAKERGRNRYEFYTESLNAAASERVDMETALRKAVERREFLVYYQPRVDIATGRILGAEALVRWQHPEMGLVPPGNFIPLAEETGLIVPISEIVLQATCCQAKQWQRAGLPEIGVDVNISARQFQQGDLLGMIKRALRDSGLEPRYLGIEITESTLMQDPNSAVETLHKLKAMGVRISIDDFGTGFSSLSYLKRFPIDAVKVDRSFIMNITEDPDDAAIAAAVVAMGHNLRLKVVGEGVETQDQLEHLRMLECDEMQGYLVSKPVPHDQFAELLGVFQVLKAA